MGRQVTGHHDIVLVEDGDQRRMAERDATIPVAGEAQTLTIDMSTYFRDKGTADAP
jgi:hypothetical protein